MEIAYFASYAVSFGCGLFLLEGKGKRSISEIIVGVGGVLPGSVYLVCFLLRTSGYPLLISLWLSILLAIMGGFLLFNRHSGRIVPKWKYLCIAGVVGCSTFDLWLLNMLSKL